MPGKGHDVVVIGTSAGGLEALEEVVSGLTPDQRAKETQVHIERIRAMLMARKDAS